MTTRRSLLATGATLTLLAPFARLAAAAANPDSRFVLVILRGGLDGLAAVPPYAEPAYAQLRGPLALAKPGTDGGALDLDGTFGLHPALDESARDVSRARSARAARSGHAVSRALALRRAERARGRRRRRRARAAGGWLNRALAALDAAGDARDAVALADSVPLVLRGELAVTSWAPSQLPETGRRHARCACGGCMKPRTLRSPQSLNDALEARAIVGDASEQRMDGRARLERCAARERGRALSRERRRPAHRRARRRRLGHACEPRRRARPARAAAARARRRACRC